MRILQPVRKVVPLLGLGALASQAGHVLAYQLLLGSAAATVQSQGVHWYFPALAKTSLAIAASVLLAGLLVVGAARFASGRPIRATSGPELMPLLSVLFTLQLTIFVVQETVESLLAGFVPHVASLLLIGSVGQLPVAFLSALAIKWLATRIEVALVALRAELVATVASFAPASVVIPLPTDIPVPALAATCPVAYIKRGPPALLRA